MSDRKKHLLVRIVIFLCIWLAIKLAVNGLLHLIKNSGSTDEPKYITYEINFEDEKYDFLRNSSLDDEIEYEDYFGVSKAFRLDCDKTENYYIADIAYKVLDELNVKNEIKALYSYEIIRDSKIGKETIKEVCMESPIRIVADDINDPIFIVLYSIKDTDGQLLKYYGYFTESQLSNNDYLMAFTEITVGKKLNKEDCILVR